MVGPKVAAADRIKIIIIIMGHVLRTSAFDVSVPGMERMAVGGSCQIYILHTPKWLWPLLLLRPPLLR